MKNREPHIADHLKMLILWQSLATIPKHWPVTRMQLVRISDLNTLFLGNWLRKHTRALLSPGRAHIFIFYQVSFMNICRVKILLLPNGVPSHSTYSPSLCFAQFCTYRYGGAWDSFPLLQAGKDALGNPKNLETDSSAHVPHPITLTIENAPKKQEPQSFETYLLCVKRSMAKAYWLFFSSGSQIQLTAL